MAYINYEIPKNAQEEQHMIPYRFFNLLYIVSFFTVTLFAVSITTHGAKAQQQELPKKFVNYIISHEDYVTSIVQKADTINKESAIRCENVQSRERLTPDLLSDVLFETREDIARRLQEKHLNEGNEEPMPVEELKPLVEKEYKTQSPKIGQWIEHVRQNGCEDLRQLNILAVAIPGEKPKLYGMNNGTTITDPYLQNLAEEKTIEATKLADFDCNTDEEAIIVDTVMEGFYNEDKTQLSHNNQGLGWQERWVTSTCNRRLDIMIQFIPNKDGEYDIKTQLYPEK